MTRTHSHTLRRQLHTQRQAIALTLPAPCHHCHQPVTWDQAWDVDHDPPLSVAPEQARAYPAHARCNRSAGARLGNARGLRSWA